MTNLNSSFHFHFHFHSCNTNYNNNNNSKPRFYSGIITAILAACLSFSFLFPLFASVGMPLATVALYVLAFGAAAVGMCLGVLLPKILPGVCFGVSSAILLAFFVGSYVRIEDYSFAFMAIVGPVLGFLGMILSIK